MRLYDGAYGVEVFIWDTAWYICSTKAISQLKSCGCILDLYENNAT